jgi:hypothetical protein
MVMHVQHCLSRWLIPLLAENVLNLLAVLLTPAMRRGDGDALATE